MIYERVYSGGSHAFGLVDTRHRASQAIFPSHQWKVPGGAIYSQERHLKKSRGVLGVF